jgi:hypothetical protein
MVVRFEKEKKNRDSAHRKSELGIGIRPVHQSPWALIKWLGESMTHCLYVRSTIEVTRGHLIPSLNSKAFLTP